MLDKKLFAALLNELATYHRREITPFAQRVWYKTVGHLTAQQFEQAIDTAIARCEFMPAPEQVAELAGAGMKHRILEYWERINQGRKSLSVAPGDTKGYDDLILSLNLDEVALKALKTLGGLTALSNLNDQDIRWTREKFVEYYQLWDARRDELHEETEQIRSLKAQSERLALPPAELQPIPDDVREQMANLLNAKMPKPEPQPVVNGTAEEYQSAAQNLVRAWRMKGLLDQKQTEEVEF